MSYQCCVCSKSYVARPEQCPLCSSKKFNVSIEVSDTLSVKDLLTGEIKNLLKKTVLKFKIGHEYFTKNNEWRFVDRLIDKRNNSYKEVITSLDGYCYKNFTEPLAKHIGHGSDKTKIVSEFNSIFGTIQFSSKFESDCELKTEIFTLKDLKNEELNCLESSYIIRFFVKNNSNEDKDIQLVAKLIDFNNDLIFDNATGENLEAFSYENNEYILYFGCPDVETLNHYNNNFQVSQVDNLVFVHQDNTFIVKYAGLKTRKEFYCHFIVAVKKKENKDDNFLTWKAVDQSKDILDEAVFNQTK